MAVPQTPKGGTNSTKPWCGPPANTRSAMTRFLNSRLIEVRKGIPLDELRKMIVQCYDLEAGWAEKVVEVENPDLQTQETPAVEKVEFKQNSPNKEEKRGSKLEITAHLHKEDVTEELPPTEDSKLEITASKPQVESVDWYNRGNGVKAPEPFQNRPSDNTGDWKCWIESFNMYLRLRGWGNAPESLKVELLLYTLGEEARRRYLELGLEPSDYSETQQRLVDLFAPHETSINFRMEFGERKQRRGETVEEFLSALRSLAAKCKFGQCEQIAIRDHFAVGLRLQKAKDDIRLEEDPDLQRVVELAVRRERVSFQKHDYHKEREPRQGEQLFRRPRSFYSVCGKCGDRHPIGRRFCAAAGRKCAYCKKNHHFEECCVDRIRDEGNDRPYGQADYLGRQDRDMKGRSLSTRVRPRKIPKETHPELRFIEVLIEGERLKMLADTGSTQSLISLKTIKRLKQKRNMRGTTARLSGYNGSNMPVVGEIKLQVKNGVRRIQCEFLVVLTGFNALGNRDLQELGIIKWIPEDENGVNCEVKDFRYNRYNYFFNKKNKVNKKVNDYKNRNLDNNPIIYKNKVNRNSQQIK